jgi:hypothetical protein
MKNLRTIICYPRHHFTQKKYLKNNASEKYLFNHLPCVSLKERERAMMNEEKEEIMHF